MPADSPFAGPGPSTPEQALIIRAYQAFNARDIDAALALMHPEVVWPNGMEGGYMQGHPAVRAYWTRQWTMIDPRVDPLNFSPGEDGRLVVEVHQVVRDLQGKTLSDQMIQHVYQFEDGLVKRMEIYKPL